LVIEDETDILDLVEYHLKQAGFSIVKAQDGPRTEVARKKTSQGLSSWT
jgi:DNA-binding response OmpR family regulator